MTESKLRVINCVTQLPFSISRTSNIDYLEDKWEVTPITGNSALYSSLQFLQEDNNYEQLLVGWTGEIVTDNTLINQQQSISEDDDPLYLTTLEKKKVTKLIQMNNDFSQFTNAYPVWLLRRDQNRWRKFADNVICPALHYLLNPPNNGKEENYWWYDYVKFNEAYANKISQIYQVGDIIWVHDYYLMLLPQLLRMRFGDNVTIAYFHHTPWPSNEYFRCLSKRKQLLDGLLGSDRICFQNESFSRHFISSCKRLLDVTAGKRKNSGGIDEYHMTAYGGDLIIDSLPIGINTTQILNDAFTQDIDEKVQAIKKAYSGKKIIFGRDKMDIMKGIVQKLQAFETFLAMYPEWRDRVVLIQVSSPTGSENCTKLETQINDLVNSINCQYGTLNSSPVQHYHMRIPKNVYLSLLRAADMCLNTSVRDGMNTTVLEYVTVKSQQSTFKCYANPLVLSEFSGTSTILNDGIVVNPWDSVAVAKEINRALTLTSLEKCELESKLWSKVPTIQNWTINFLDKMVQIKEMRHSNKNKITPALNRPLLLQNYKSSHRRLFLFDYDGTLTPIVQDPAAAIPSARLFSILSKLSSDPENQIWIISGRDQKFLSRWLGSRMPELGLSAEHGCFMKDINDDTWVNLTTKFDMSWQLKVSKLMDEFTIRTPGSFIETKKVALTWHYRRADPELGEFNALELKKSLETFTNELDLEVMEGKANIEVRPKFVNKGEIVKRLVWHPHGTKQLFDGDGFTSNTNPAKEYLPDFVLCLGDDFTDEDMFKQLNIIEDAWREKFPDNRNEWGHYGIYPVTVGSASKMTVAKAHLTDPQQVLDTLGLLVGDVSLFQSPGTVELDDRGHVKNSESSNKSEIAIAAYAMKRNGSSQKS